MELFPFSDEELNQDHPGLKKHGIQVMESIGAAINLLSNPEELKEVLLQMGIIHNMLNVQVESFAVSSLYIYIYIYVIIFCNYRMYDVFVFSYIL